MDDDRPIETVTVTLADLTLGEADYLERLSGMKLSALLATLAGKLMMGVALAEYRTSPGSASSSARRSWPEISALRLVDASPSISPFEPAGDPTP